MHINSNTHVEPPAGAGDKPGLTNGLKLSLLFFKAWATTVSVSASEAHKGDKKGRERPHYIILKCSLLQVTSLTVKWLSW